MENPKKMVMIPLAKKIDQIFRKTGHSANFMRAINSHLKVMLEAKDEEDIESRFQLCNYLMSKMFIDKLDLYPYQVFNCPVDENSGWPVKVIPSEVFGDSKMESFRKNSFYKCLKVGDILECRVSDVLPTEYRLRVIHKYGITRLLDDLNIEVVMHRNKDELSILQNDLLSCELIRVAVNKIINKGEIIYVTVDEKSVQFTRTIPKLGRIDATELPPYVLDPQEADKYSVYSEYLNSMPQFRNPIALNSILRGFGMDESFGKNSFYPKYNNRLTRAEQVNNQTFLNESKLTDTKNYTTSAMQNLEKKNFGEALKWIEKGLQVCPKEDPLLCKLYEIRSDIHAALEQPKFSKKAYIDLELAWTADPNNQQVKSKLSKAMFKCANRHFQLKQFKDAYKALEKAIELCANNCYAATLLSHIKNKYGDSLKNLDEESLYVLKEKRKEIVTQLKKADPSYKKKTSY